MIYDPNYTRKIKREQWALFYALRDKKNRTYEENKYVKKFKAILNEKYERT